MNINPIIDQLNAPSLLTGLKAMACRLSVPPKCLAAEADAGHMACLIADGAYLFEADAVMRVIREWAEWTGL